MPRGCPGGGMSGGGGVEDVVVGDRVGAPGQDGLEEVDLLVQEGHLDQEGPSRRAREIGVAHEAQAAIARSQRHVGHQAKLLGRDLGVSPRGRHVVPQMFARTIGRGRGGDPGPEQAPEFDRAVNRRRCRRNSRLSRRLLAPSPRSAA